MPLTGGPVPDAPVTGPVPSPAGAADPAWVPRLIGRGAASGALAGLLSSAFSLVLAEPVIDRAVRLEEARERAAHPGAAMHAEVFGRGTQHLGLVVAAVAAGIALGVLFALVYALVHRRDPMASPWERSMRLAGASLVGVWLLPYVRYPANPPGVGDPATLGERTAGWLGAIVIGAGAVALAWRMAVHLKDSAPPVRQGVPAAIVLAGLGALFLLPPNSDATDVPAGLLWDFRLLSAAASILLWTAIGAVFGLLGLRAAARSGTNS